MYFLRFHEFGNAISYIQIVLCNFRCNKDIVIHTTWDLTRIYDPRDPEWFQHYQEFQPKQSWVVSASGKQFTSYETNNLLHSVNQFVSTFFSVLFTVDVIQTFFFYLSNVFVVALLLSAIHTKAI